MNNQEIKQKLEELRENHTSVEEFGIACFNLGVTLSAESPITINNAEWNGEGDMLYTLKQVEDSILKLLIK